ncbi:MAG: glucose-1-phosphate adenylyltransferase [Pirellulaceae bacterium]|jgi:glucose-1-phosphate adenylyltransferase|nr:glucose-1-phosphate adenylyltransferase [Pirellulaceae bacterium]MDP7015347.1 glucose-1-phosphate adenylyltransferase [Pirellulaceae bacterium]
MHNVIAFVLGGGRGTRLFPLTALRSKPAVPLGGKYRLIDIPISNCINSGVNRIYVLTQFMSVSLHRHIRQTYRFDRFGGGYVELLAAQQTMDKGTDWYEGTADAVRKNLRYLQQSDIDYVVILSGDQLYRMDYGEMLRTHRQSGADVTIAALPVDRRDAQSLGVMRVDESGRVKGFLEKPQSEDEIDMVAMEPALIDSLGVESKGRDCLASMGIYIFNRDVLVRALDMTPYQDFGKEIFPAAIRSQHVQAYAFDGYWEDIGTIRAFYDANLSLASSNPPFQLTAADSPIYSRARFLPPSLIEGGAISGSLIADGCRIGSGSTIENSVIGLRCTIGENVKIVNSIIMGHDDYDWEDSSKSAPPAIGDGAVIAGSIVDKNCLIGAGARIENTIDAVDLDVTPECVIRDGIPVVVKNSVIEPGWKISAP